MNDCNSESQKYILFKAKQHLFYDIILFSPFKYYKLVLGKSLYCELLSRLSIVVIFDVWL